jgi:hypothetical protein
MAAQDGAVFLFFHRLIGAGGRAGRLVTVQAMQWQFGGFIQLGMAE